MATALGEAEAEIELGLLQIRHRVLKADADIDDHFIMGMDLIGKYRLLYNPEQQILKLYKTTGLCYQHLTTKQHL